MFREVRAGAGHEGRWCTWNGRRVAEPKSRRLPVQRLREVSPSLRCLIVVVEHETIGRLRPPKPSACHTSPTSTLPHTHHSAAVASISPSTRTRNETRPTMRSSLQLWFALVRLISTYVRMLSSRKWKLNGLRTAVLLREGSPSSRRLVRVGKSGDMFELRERSCCQPVRSGVPTYSCSGEF